MSRWFYPRFAWGSIRKNSQIYFPYYLVGSLTVALFYMFLSMADNPWERLPRGGASVPGVLWSGIWIIGVFSGLILLYANSFLIKRRKKEFGLLHVLGTGKRQLIYLLFLETLIILGCSLLTGLLVGTVLRQLFITTLIKLLGFDLGMDFPFQLQHFGKVILFFIAIYFINFGLNAIKIRLADATHLFQSGRQGEKEPKTRIFWSLFGFSALFLGYLIALNPFKIKASIELFLLAIILVIVGTYLLFIAGSILILKALRQSKKIYYRATNFPVISGLIYRMRQNGAGLANICILCTMVLVTVTTTLSFYVGVQRSVKEEAPYDVIISSEMPSLEKLQYMESMIKDTAESHQQELRNFTSVEYFSLLLKEKADFFSDQDLDMSDEAPMDTEFIFLPLSDYQRLEGHDVALQANQMFVWQRTAVANITTDRDSITLRDWTFKVQDAQMKWLFPGRTYMPNSYMAVVTDQDFAKLKKIYNMSDLNSYMTVFDVTDLTRKDAQEMLTALDTKLKKFVKDHILPNEVLGLNISMQNRLDINNSLMSEYGTLLLLGIFVSFLFLVAVILIIAYKQISEGLDDRERYQIMKQVGMSNMEIKRSVRRQVLLVFAIPPLLAISHTALALPYFLSLLWKADYRRTEWFDTIFFVTIGIFLLIYVLAYFLTARTYYRIITVKRR